MGDLVATEICLNGHYTNNGAVSWGADPLNRYCQTCGAAVITKCVHCFEPVAGASYIEEVGDMFFALPAYCYGCGKAYPWTERMVRAARQLADEQDALTPEERELLKESIGEITQNTPLATVAARRIQRLAGKAGPGLLYGLREIVVGVVTEAVKQQLFTGS
jgi:hypothetical protein